jgi:hypothetical protein
MHAGKLMNTYLSWIRHRRRDKHQRSVGKARRHRSLLGFEQLEARDLLAVDIVINPDAGLSANADALAAFDRAAQAWESYLADDITVTIDAGLDDLGDPNIIGQTGSVLLQGGYTGIRDQLVADAADEADDAIVGSLPTAAEASFWLPAGFSLDGNVVGTKASLKAAGFTGLDAQFGASDAEITFNSTFQFDFDNSDGVTAHTMDFETVATHEIGHALGFISQVDTVDVYAYLGIPTSVAPSTLDLFRFENNSADDPDDAASFTAAARSLVPGVDAITDDVTGAGASAAENRMSTGAYTGDGRQASHFKDDLGIGIMDPTLQYGEVVPISDADLRALDLIGYEVSFGPVQNIAPAANDDAATIGKKSGAAEGNVLDNDSDANGDSLTAIIVDGPADGTVEFDTETGSFVYTPGTTFSGTDTFSYQAFDGEDYSNVATVTITSKGGGSSSKGGGAGGGGGGGSAKPDNGKGGGKPTNVETVAVGFSSAAQSRLVGSFSLYETVVPEGALDSNAAGGAAGAIDQRDSAPPHDAGSADSPSVGQLLARFGSSLREHEEFANTEQQAEPVTPGWIAPATSVGYAFSSLESGLKRQEGEAIDRVMAELADAAVSPPAAELLTPSAIDQLLAEL